MGDLIVLRKPGTISFPESVADELIQLSLDIQQFEIEQNGYIAVGDSVPQDLPRKLHESREKMTELLDIHCTTKGEVPSARLGLVVYGRLRHFDTTSIENEVSKSIRRMLEVLTEILERLFRSSQLHDSDCRRIQEISMDFATLERTFRKRLSAHIG